MRGAALSNVERAAPNTPQNGPSMKASVLTIGPGPSYGGAPCCHTETQRRERRW